MRGAIVAAAVLVLATAVCGKVFLNEEFNSLDKWTVSSAKSDYGKVALSSGDFFGDKTINQGLKTTENARLYAVSREVEGGVTNEGKELVVSVSVKHEQGLDCGGGYIKLLPAMDASKFDGETEYAVMFGPDQCGYNRRVHAIFNYKGKNLLWKKEPRYPDDKLTHVYTLRVLPTNKYEVYIDKELKESGDLEKDWDFLAPKEVDDPTDKKPEGWPENAEIADPTDTKPADWDAEPAMINDPEAKKPEDWDDEEDGAWEPPQIPNPKSKGPWKARQIPNPEYKGPWKARQIPNPEYVADEKLYLLQKPIAHVGIDVWQVKAGSIFDNIIIADNLEEVNALIDATWGATKEAEAKAQSATTAGAEKEAAGSGSEAKGDDDDEM